MKNISIASFLALMIQGHVSFADTDKLFTVARSFNQITITPAANHDYPSMGIHLTSGHTVSGCTPSSNGYCLFRASKKEPGKLTISGSMNKLEGTVCLSGLAEYSCQKITDTTPLCSRTICTKCGGSDCRVFVSSESVSIPITEADAPVGRPAADKICQRLAAAAPLPRPQNYRAWLSITGSKAIDHVGYTLGVKYVRASDTSWAVLESSTDLAAGSLDGVIELDESGVNPAGVATWTGTLSNGFPSPSTCSDWKAGLGSGLAGNNGQMSSLWTETGLANCSSTQVEIYCFEKPDSN